MNNTSYRDKLNQLIENGELQLAIRDLSDKLKLVKDLLLEDAVEKFIGQTITVSYQYKRLNDNRIEGTISFADAENSENRILRSFRSLLDGIPLKYFYFLDLYMYDSLESKNHEKELQKLIGSPKPSIVKIRWITKKIRQVSIQEFWQIIKTIGERLLEENPSSIHPDYYQSLEVLLIVALKRNESDSWLADSADDIFDLLCLGSFVIRQAELEIHKKYFIHAVKKMGRIMYNLNSAMP